MFLVVTPKFSSTEPFHPDELWEIIGNNGGVDSDGVFANDLVVENEVDTKFDATCYAPRAVAHTPDASSKQHTSW